jgi:hypothetical protein
VHAALDEIGEHRAEIHAARARGHHHDVRGKIALAGARVHDRAPRSVEHLAIGVELQVRVEDHGKRVAPPGEPGRELRVVDRDRARPARIASCTSARGVRRAGLRARDPSRLAVRGGDAAVERDPDFT